MPVHDKGLKRAKGNQENEPEGGGFVSHRTRCLVAVSNGAPVALAGPVRAPARTPGSVKPQNTRTVTQGGQQWTIPVAAVGAAAETTRGLWQRTLAVTRLVAPLYTRRRRGRVLQIASTKVSQTNQPIIEQTTYIAEPALFASRITRSRLMGSGAILNGALTVHTRPVITRGAAVRAHLQRTRTGL